MSFAAGFGGASAGPSGSDKGLSLPLLETLRLAMADSELRGRILFVLQMFAIFAFGVHVQVPIPGLSATDLVDILKKIPQFQMLNMFGGGALKRISIFSLGMNPYITASIIIQILYTAFPHWKKELQEGGEFARREQNRRTRLLMIALCLIQGFSLLKLMMTAPGFPALSPVLQFTTVMFWTAGSFFILWLGEQISERGIGNGVSLMIFAGIVLSLPTQFDALWQWSRSPLGHWYSLPIMSIIFLAGTYLIVYFTTAQRRIPIQHMRRQVGTKMMGGQTSYLPLSVNMAGVLPIIFAVSLLYLPAQFGMMVGGQEKPLGAFLLGVSEWLSPASTNFWKATVACIIYTGMIFFFTYFWTAIQYNVGDIADNLKKHGSFIPGVRPGRQTKEFLDNVISRVTIVGAAFIAIIALMQYISPKIARVDMNAVNVLGGTSLLIMVSVALETMRQIEANLLMKQYGN